jgi:proteasome lid subunit RPN8/RPN11
MVTEVTSGVVATVLAEAARAHPHECCGLLLGQGQGERIDEARPAINVHPQPDRHFEIDPTALIAAHRAERAGTARLLGYYHSHPSGSILPSSADRSMASGDGRVWAIVGQGALAFWRDGPDGFESVSYRVIDS